MTDTRPVFFRIGDTGELIFYVLAALTVALFVNGVWRRVRKYRRGPIDLRTGRGGQVCA